MDAIGVVQRVFSYGCMGILLEVFFTGMHSLYRKNWRAQGHTYLWMLPIYGLGGVLLESLQRVLQLHFVLMALVYVPVIFSLEFVSGWLLKKWLGRCPWEYGASRFTILGLVRLDYAPYWLGLALLFHPVSWMVQSTLKMMGQTLRAWPTP